MKRIIILCIALLLLCGCADTSYSILDYESVGNTPTASQQPGKKTANTEKGDGAFTLRYAAEDSLNPFICETETNRQLSSLIYEELLSVSETFTLEAGLCITWDTDESGKRFTLNLREDAMFSDGSNLTAADVVYSLRCAGESNSLFASRLGAIASVTAITDNEIELTLREANPSFLLRLDIPVVKQNTGYDAIPIGSGPYIPSFNSERNILTKNLRYPNSSSLPYERIYLCSYQDEELTDAISTGALDMILADPATLSNMGTLNGISRHAVSTSILSYLLVNTYSEPLADAGRRRLVNSMLDRESLSIVLNGEVTLLPLHPTLTEYDRNTAESWLYSDIADACIQVLTEDYDGDGMLEYFSDGTPADFELTLLACSDNPFSAAAARSISDSLKNYGVLVNLKLLSEKQYLESMKKGEYDLCLLSMRLTSDFDLYSLAKTTKDGYLLELCENYRIRQGESRVEAASALAAYLGKNSIIMPLSFQYRIALTSDEMQFTVEPTWTDPFHHLQTWSKS